MFCLSLSVFLAYVALSAAARCNLSNGKSGTCMLVGQCGSMKGMQVENSASCTTTNHACCGPQLAPQPQQPSQPVTPVTPVVPTGVAQCTSPGGKAGQCINIAQCPSPFKKYPSSAGASGCGSFPAAVQCCAPEGVAPGGGAAGQPSTNVGCAGAMFPLASGSLRYISVNWGGSRGGGRRCHAGVDIYTANARQVVASYAGVVTNIAKNWYRCSGGSIDAIFVYMTSGPLAGHTINYGEVNPGTYSVTTGSTVSTGQKLGIARNCGMLHFELYKGRRVRNSYWYPGSGGVGPGCHIKWMSRKPAEMLDPRPFLRCTAPTGFKTRPGTSFLTDEDLSELVEDDSNEGEPAEPMAAGTIIAIATVVSALFLAFLVLALVLVLRRRRN